MPVSKKKLGASKFPLRLMPSIRRVAESFSQKEGVSLNQFINVAVAEKLAHLQHEDWLLRRPKISESLLNQALDIIDRPTGNSVESFDRVPQGYRSAQRSSSAQKSTTRRGSRISSN